MTAHRSFLKLIATVTAVAALAIAGCSSSGTPVAPVPEPSPTLHPTATPHPSSTPSPTATPSPTPTSAVAACAANSSACDAPYMPGPDVSPYPLQSSKHLYVAVYTFGDTYANGGFLVFNEPLTASSTPLLVSNARTGPYFGLAVDAEGQLFATPSQSQNIDVYSAPLTASSAPLFTLPALIETVLTFDASNDLVAEGEFAGGCFRIFPPPFTSTSGPAHFYAGTARALAISGHRFFVGQTPYEIVVDPPYTSTTSNVVLLGVDPDEGIWAQVVDSAGNLIVASKSLLVYPQSSIVGYSASPTVTATLPAPPTGSIQGLVSMGYDAQGHLIMTSVSCIATNGTFSCQSSLFVYDMPLTNSSVPIMTMHFPGEQLGQIVAGP